MVAQVQLKQLVDLAINDTDTSSVNFTHLRTLLLGILHLTDTEKSVVEPKFLGASKESTSVEKNNVSDLHNNIADELDNFPKNNIDSGLSINASPEIWSVKVPELESNQRQYESRLVTLEKTLNDYEKFPSNEELLGKSLETTDNNTKTFENGTYNKFGITWQNRKLTKRLEAVEEGTDKLFSLINDLLSQKNLLKNQNEITKDVKEEDSLDRFTDFVKKIQNEQIELRNLLNQNKEQSAISEDGIVKVKNISDANKQSIDKCNAEVGRINELMTDLNKKVSGVNTEVRLNSASEIMPKKDIVSTNNDSISQPNVDLSMLIARVENLEKNMLNQVENSLNSQKNLDSSSNNLKTLKDEDGPKNLEKTLLYQEENSVNIQKQLDSLSSKLDSLQNELSKKADQSVVNSLSSKIDTNQSEIKQLIDQVTKLQQSVSNMDDSALKDIINNMEQLRKMTNEIDDLRKLSHLEDLADNVQDLNKLKELIDKLNENCQQNTEQNCNLQNETSTLKDNMTNININNENLSKEVASMKDLFSRHNIDKLLDDAENLASKNPENTQDNVTNNNDDLMRTVAELKIKVDKLQTEGDSLMNKYEKIQTHVASKDSQRPLSPAFDASVLAAIQNLAQQNRQQIAALQADLNILRKVQKPSVVVPIEDNENSGNSEKFNLAFIENFRDHLDALQEEQVRLSGHVSNTVDDMKGEFNRKQQHIDALYGYIEQLQHGKADKEDINSEMDVKADKQALDGKVNMSTFDERYQLLEHTLQDALSRLDKFVNQEENLKDSLNKLNEDLNSKMDSDAEKKLKKFLDSRLKEIQNSRTSLPDNSYIEMDMRNAAGLRKPMPLSYSCISCDRPIDVTMRGVQPPVPHNFPSKKSMGPHTSFEIDQIRQARRTPQPSYEKVFMNRQCGGQHTSINATTYRGQKQAPLQSMSSDIVDVVDKSPESEHLSIVDCVIGKDGQIYRGRFRQNDRPPPLPKRIPYQNPRMNKFHNRHKFTHSATPRANYKTLLASSPDETRSHSASVLEKQLSNGNSTTVLLPPISRDNSVMSEEMYIPSPLDPLQFNNSV